jgi:hypothetical protein
MNTATKVALGLGAVALAYVVLRPKEAQAASPTPAPSPVGPRPEKAKAEPPKLDLPPLPPVTEVPALPLPAGVTPTTAALYVAVQSATGETISPWQQIAVIDRRAANRDGLLVHLISRLSGFAIASSDVVWAATVDASGAPLHTLMYRGDTQIPLQRGFTYVIVGYTLNALQSVYPTSIAAWDAKDPGVVIFPGENNGSADGSVQRATASNLLLTDTTGDLAYAVVYDGQAEVDIDPDTGREFIVLRPGVLTFHKLPLATCHKLIMVRVCSTRTSGAKSARL